MTSIPLTTDTITIELSQGYTATVSPEDADLAALNWFVQRIPSTDKCYAGRRSGKRREYLHRIILARMVGRPLKRGEQVDHTDGNGLNNRRDNLRVATHAQNMRNRKMYSNNTSGYKGVSWHKRDKKWQALIHVNGKCIHLGYFDTPEEAHAAYCEAAKRLHGEFHNLG